MPNPEASGASNSVKAFRAFRGVMLTVLSAAMIGAWTTLVDMRDAIKRMESNQGYEAQYRAQKDGELQAQIERIDRDSRERTQSVWDYLWRKDGKR